jgi:hypothetical protein
MPPFTDAYPPEVLARVAVQWVLYCWVRCKCDSKDGVAVLQEARDANPLSDTGLLATALSALQFHIIRGGRMKDWKARAVFLSRGMKGFRRCWFDDYKGKRRR